MGSLGHVGSFVTHFGKDKNVRPTGLRPLSRAIRRLHPYFAVKEAIEKHLLRAASKQRVAIINPVGILGPWDWKSRHLCLVPRTVGGDFPATTGHLGNVVDTRDVAEIVVRAVVRKVWGEPILVAGHSLPMSVLMQRIAQAAGKRSFQVPLPVSAGIAGLLGIETALALVGKETPLPSLTMFIVAHCKGIKPSAAQVRLGVVPRPLEETIEDSVAWYLAHPRKYVRPRFALAPLLKVA